MGKSIFLPRKKEKNKILLCLGSLAGDRRVSEARYYSPYLKGKEVEIHDTFLLNAHCLPGAMLELLDDTDVVIVVQLLSHVQLSCDPWTVAYHGISQARILEWVAISSSRGSDGQQEIAPSVGSLFKASQKAWIQAASKSWGRLTTYRALC